MVLGLGILGTPDTACCYSARPWFTVTNSESYRIMIQAGSGCTFVVELKLPEDRQAQHYWIIAWLIFLPSCYCNYVKYRFVSNQISSFFVPPASQSSNINATFFQCESLYVYGCMLLLVDLLFEGPVREKIMVSPYRLLYQRVVGWVSWMLTIAQTLTSIR